MIPSLWLIDHVAYFAEYKSLDKFFNYLAGIVLSLWSALANFRSNEKLKLTLMSL